MSTNDLWMTKVSGSPITLPTDGEEILIFNAEEEQNSQPLLGNEFSTQLYPIDNYDQFFNTFTDDLNTLPELPDDPIQGRGSQERLESQLLSQGQMRYIERDVGFTALSDVSFGDLVELEVNKREDLGVGFPGGVNSEPGPSHHTFVSQKKLIEKDEIAGKGFLETNCWAGDYDFRVRPTEGGNSKKCIFWAEKNKIYVAKEHHINFKFLMEYSRMEYPELFTISVMLVYTDAQYRDVPVLRCLLCKEKEKSGPNPDRLNHIVRCQTRDARYEQAEGSRCRVIYQVQKPQPGVETFSKNFMFTCLSSCKSGEVGREGGIQRRPTAIIFNMVDPEGKICGRDVFNVRICSAPLRDYNKDKDDESPQTKKRKSKTNSNSNVVTPKVPKVQSSITSTTFVNANDDDLKPTSSSQETCYSDDDTGTENNTIKLRSVMRTVKWALKYKNSENRLLRAKAKEIFYSVKMTKTLGDNMKALVEDIEGGNAKGSPDQGYQDLE